MYICIPVHSHMAYYVYHTYIEDQRRPICFILSIPSIYSCTDYNFIKCIKIYISKNM